MTDQTLPVPTVPEQPVQDPTRPSVPDQVIRDVPGSSENVAEPLAEEPASPRRRFRRREPRRQSAFRRWRKTRPFWGGFLTMLGGAEIALVTAASYELILLSKSVAFAISVGAAVVVFGLTMWLSPALSKLLGLLTLVAALLSFVTANLGGFLVGMLLAIVGGGLSFAWEPGRAIETDEETVEAADAEDDEEPRPEAHVHDIPQQRAPGATEQLHSLHDVAD